MLDRRSFLTSAGAAALSAPTVPVTAGDVELVAMAEQVAALRHQAAAAKAAMRAELEFSPAWGEHCAVADDLLSQADRIVRVMWSIKATSESGRQAKLRALYSHCVAGHAEWAEPLGNGDWGVDQARRLLAEFAGLVDPGSPMA